jgi:hypothetical protein
MSSDSLQNELVAFVDSHVSHPEIIRSQIIKAFDTMKSTSSQDKPGVGSLGVMIIKHIVDNIKSNVINTSDDIHHALAQFGLCVDVINIFLERLCVTERNHNHGTYSNSLTPYMMCVRMGELVHPLQPGLSTTGHGIPNINELVKNQINQYQAKILKLWSDVLIRQGKIKSDTIDEMKTIVGKQDGYERKMRELYEKCKQGAFKSHLDESILLEWLALFNVASIAQITNIYGNVGSLDYIVFGILSQFMPLNNVYGYSGVPQSKNNASKFNVMRLTCDVVLPATNSFRLPIIAYLSSDELDQCVRDIRQFPTAEQFLTYMPTAHERFQALKARLVERQQANKSSPITIEQPLLTAQEKFQALKSRVREQQLANQSSLLTIEPPIMTAQERFQALKSRLREQQMKRAGGKKIKSKINKSCRKYRKKSCR